MKVLLNGKEKVYTKTCNKCNSDLEYTEDDVFYINEERRGGICKTISRPFKDDEHYTNVYTQEYSCVRCPVCDNIIKSISFRSGLQNLKTIRWERTE